MAGTGSDGADAGGPVDGRAGVAGESTPDRPDAAGVGRKDPVDVVRNANVPFIIRMPAILAGKGVPVPFPCGMVIVVSRDGRVVGTGAPSKRDAGPEVSCPPTCRVTAGKLLDAIPGIEKLRDSYASDMSELKGRLRAHTTELGTLRSGVNKAVDDVHALGVWSDQHAKDNQEAAHYRTVQLEKLSGRVDSIEKLVDGLSKSLRQILRDSPPSDPSRAGNPGT